MVPGTSRIHSDTFAKALEAKVSLDPLNENTDWIFVVGASPEALTFVPEARKQGKKVALYWIGSDSLTALGDSVYRKNIPECDIHFSVHERIQEELESWGVKSNVVYPCARNYFTKDEVPKRRSVGRSVGVYSPSPGPNDLYMFNECLQVARENRDVEFIFYGADAYSKMPDNCVDAGRMTPEDTKDIYARVGCIMRLVQHDGFPVGGIEAKIRNMKIIENFPYPGFEFAETLEDVNKLLKKEETFQEDKGPWPSFYREMCAPKAFKKNIEAALF